MSRDRLARIELRKLGVPIKYRNQLIKECGYCPLCCQPARTWRKQVLQRLKSMGGAVIPQNVMNKDTA